jgi:hypothetical protein
MMAVARRMHSLSKKSQQGIPERLHYDGYGQQTTPLYPAKNCPSGDA